MNNDPTPPPAADLNLPPSTSSDNPVVETATSREAQQNAQTPAQKRAQAQTKKRYEFVNGLMMNLDVMIYAELCIIYYMDCSAFRLILRVFAQLVFLTPKPNFIPPMPQHRPYIGMIFGPNIICMLLHALTARSEAGEAMRGYLHGGVIIDLIGQKGPTSKLHLLILDILILGLQCFMLTVHMERERLAALLAAFASPTLAADQPRVEVVSSQDHDAEERGVIREAVANHGDIELQPMTSTTEATSSRNNERTTEQDEERERLLAEPPPREETENDDTPLDAFWSGTAIVADFHVLRILRKQWEDHSNASASALQTVGFSAEFAAVTANRRLNAAGARLQRDLEAMGA